MNIKQILTWLPVALALLGSLYTGINVVSKLNNTIEQHTLTINSMVSQIDSIDQKYTIEVKNLTQKYTEAREELVKEMTQVFSQITEIKVKTEALRDNSFKMASEAELRALENSYYKLDDELNQLTYDIKDLKRELTGGY
jgi:predicted  nucleic acid-binding Zn-ribbon protein|tara:strand:+ start:943 stop:1362 length:420 start_codon:yes stop_codon:yes gene_type:complete